MLPAMDERPVHRITIALTERQFRNLEALAGGASGPEGVQEVIGRLADHADQGVYRSGSWERAWLCQAFGEEWLERLEPDPRGLRGWQRPKGAPHAGGGQA